MNKLELAEGIQVMHRDLGSEDTLEPQLAIWAADKVRGALLLEAELTGDFFDNYTKPVISSGGNKYVDLGNSLVNLPMDQGIREVGPGFIPVQSNHDLLTKGVVGGKMGSTSWYLLNNKIYLKDLADEKKEVVVQMIPTINSLAPRERIPMPQSLEMIIIARTYELLREKRNLPEDKTTDQR